MAKYTSVGIEGADELIRKLKALGDKAQDVIGPATKEGAELVKAEIEARTPVDTGALKSEGFETKPGSMKDEAANTVVTLSNRKYVYAYYLEFGAQDRGMGGGTFERLAKKLVGRKGTNLPAHPFIRPAFKAKKAEAAKVVEEALKRALGL